MQKRENKLKKGDPATKTPNSSLQDRSTWSNIGYKGAAVILDAILNYTFLPHIWNVYPSFFKISYGSPIHGSKVKIRGHMIAHRTPSAPGLCIVSKFAAKAERRLQLH